MPSAGLLGSPWSTACVSGAPPEPEVPPEAKSATADGEQGRGSKARATTDIAVAQTLPWPGTPLWQVGTGRNQLSKIEQHRATVLDDVAERQLVTDKATLQLCRSAFEAVRAVAVPHDEYTPH